MKTSFTILLISFWALTTYSQALKMDFYPAPNDNVDETSYNKGKHILTNSYQAIKEATNGLNYADFWNVAYGMALMGGDRETIFSHLKQSKKLTPSSFCKIVYYQMDAKENAIENSFYYKIFGERYRELVSDCETLKEIDTDPHYNTKTNMDLTGLDENLIDQLIAMNEKDQRFRNMDADYQANWAAQTRLDNENQAQLTEILKTYGYPGKSLVGDRFMDSACLIFEHGGSIDYQQKYFPLIIDALSRGEVNKPVVRMLVDRIHWKTTGKQIFGSHMDIPFDEDEVIEKMKRKYKL